MAFLKFIEDGSIGVGLNVTFDEISPEFSQLLFAFTFLIFSFIAVLYLHVCDFLIGKCISLYKQNKEDYLI